MDTDILIIGGGIAGVSLAAALAPAAAVTLVEAEGALAFHASGRSAALYEPHYGNPAVVALSLASGEAFHALEGILSPRGQMLVADAASEAAGRAEAAAMALDPMPVGDAVARVPILRREVLTFAAMADHAWDIDTDRLIQTLARTARAAGARVLTRAPVTALEREGGGWRAETASETGAGTLRARVVVNAAGAWADRMAGMAGVAPLGLRPLRRSMARIPAPGGHDVSRWPMVFGAGETCYFKPDAGALIVSPAEEDPVDAPHDAFADDMVIAEGLARYEALVTEPVTRVLATWAGLRTFSPDRAPVIGFGAAPGFFWLAGQGGYGFQSAPAAARLAADLILGRSPEIGAGIAARLDPARFG
jgi:glycine/D-amino acid oxidase-like deaminating enzyme